MIYIEEDLLKAAAEHSYDSVLITTTDLDLPGPIILYANKAFCNMSGYALDDLLGKTPRILQGDLTDKNVLLRLRYDLNQNHSFEGATVNYRKNGEAYVVRWSISPIKDSEGNVVRYYSTQRDISDEVGVLLSDY